MRACVFFVREGTDWRTQGLQKNEKNNSAVPSPLEQGYRWVPNSRELSAWWSLSKKLPPRNKEFPGINHRGVESVGRAGLVLSRGDSFLLQTHSFSVETQNTLSKTHNQFGYHTMNHFSVSFFRQCCSTAKKSPLGGT